MAQDYYTLEEASRMVGMSPDELKQLARKGELRSFQDRGTWRFRVQDIQELARTRGFGSDPELGLGEAPVPKPGDSPVPRSPAPKSREAEVFDFSLGGEEDIGIGHELLGGPAGSGRKPGSSRRNPKSGPKSPPPPPPGSDSDVRLVADGSDAELQMAIDSDAKLVEEPKSGKQGPRSKAGPISPPPRGGPISPPPRGGPISPPPSSKAPQRRTGLPPTAPPVDSGVRLVPLDSDSDVRIVGATSDDAELPIGKESPRSSTDSDIRLERPISPPPGSDEGLLTEEINLDEELRKDAGRKSSPQAKIRPKPPTPPEFPNTSPFELSESDLNLPAAPSAELPQVKTPSSSDFDLTPAKESPAPTESGSSDFELTPAGSSPLEPGSDDEFRLELPDDEVNLGEAQPPSELSGPTSGIQLEHPVDTGISLEQGGDGSDEIEFTLSLDAEGTPKPSAGGAATPMSDSSSSEFELTLDAPESQAEGADTSSEFELTLDADDSKSALEDSSSEFELTLDGDEAKADLTGSDSEFELTLDEGGGLSPLEPSDELALEDVSEEKAEKDIFDTDFEVPDLEEESGSEAMALEDADTDLGSSDFDLDVGDAESSSEESGSVVVALDEEEEASEFDKTRQAIPTPKKKKQKVAVPDDEESFPDLDEEAPSDFEGLAEGEEEPVPEAEEDEEPVRTVVKEKLLPSAPWGAMPLVFMLPCVLVMFVVVLLGFELVQSVGNYKSPGLLTRALGDLLGQKFK